MAHWCTAPPLCAKSDAAVEAPFGGVYEFREGKVVRVRILGSRDEAHEAARLSE